MSAVVALRVAALRKLREDRAIAELTERVQAVSARVRDLTVCRAVLDATQARARAVICERDIALQVGGMAIGRWRESEVFLNHLGRLEAEQDGACRQAETGLLEAERECMQAQRIATLAIERRREGEHRASDDARRARVAREHRTDESATERAAHQVHRAHQVVSLTAKRQQREDSQ